MKYLSLNIFIIALSAALPVSSMNINTTDNADAFAVNANWYTDPVKSPFTYMESTMVIPPLPSTDWQLLFIWPGLQSLKSSPNREPIGNGVIQPVLTWGNTSCAPNPNKLKNDGKGWWISAQYVNTHPSAPEVKDICYGGNRMSVKPGDVIRMVMELQPGTTIWKQFVVNKSTRKNVTFQKDLKGQAQGWAEWVMETPKGWHERVPQWNVTDIILRTSGSIKPHQLCSYKEVLLPSDKIPGGSLSCSRPIKKRNECHVSLCKFNQGSL